MRNLEYRALLNTDRQSRQGSGGLLEGRRAVCGHGVAQGKWIERPQTNVTYMVVLSGHGPDHMTHARSSVAGQLKGAR